MFAESFLYSLEVAVASRSCDGRQEGRLRSVRVEELEDPGRVDRGGQGQDSSLRKFMSCNVIKRQAFLFCIYIQLTYFILADLWKIWPGL